MIRSILYIILSGISFFCVNFIVKMFGQTEHPLIEGLQTYPTHELVFFRSLISFSISFAIIKYRGLPVLGNNRKWLFLRGTSGMIALTLFFFTLHHLPLAIASTLQYLSPIFTVLIAGYLFKESISRWQYYCSVLAFGGVVLIGINGISGGLHISQSDLIWIGLGIISSFLSGIAYNAIVKLRTTEEPINIVIYFPMLALPLTGIWCLFDFTIPRGIEWLLLLLIGIFTQIAQVLLTRALMFGKTTTIVPFQYLGAIYALVTGWFIFDEQLEWISLLGIVLIIGGVIINALIRKQVNPSDDKGVNVSNG